MSVQKEHTKQVKYTEPDVHSSAGAAQNVWLQYVTMMHLDIILEGKNYRFADASPNVSGLKILIPIIIRYFRFLYYQ